MPSRFPSFFTTQFDAVVERWAAVIPAHLQRAFRADFHAFGDRFEATLDTLEDIWERRERAYAFDESTGLATRGPFYDYLKDLLRELPGPGLAAIGVLFMDVDDLKRINDTCGHQVGDRAIAAIGTIVRDALREGHADRVVRLADDDFAVGRHGGDEFVAALQLADPADIQHVVPRVKHRADDRDRQHARGYSAPVALTISVGGVAYELSDNPPHVSLNSLATALLTSADALMYESKRDRFIHVARARFTDKLEVYGEQRISADTSPSDG